jgi:hypothetical protein
MGSSLVAAGETSAECEAYDGQTTERVTNDEICKLIAAYRKGGGDTRLVFVMNHELNNLQAKETLGKLAHTVSGSEQGDSNLAWYSRDQQLGWYGIVQVKQGL